MVKSYKQMTVEQFQKMPEKIDEIDLEILTEIISILSNKTIEEIEEETTLEDLQNYINELKWLTELPEGNPPLEVKINGNKYIMPKDYNKSLKYGQWMDLESFIMSGFRENLHNILAVIYQDKKNFFQFKKQDEIELFFKRAEEMKQLTMDKAYPTIVFFYHFVNLFLKNTLDYSIIQMEQMNQEMKNQQINQELKY
jgi:hypothetical protein